MSRNPIQPWIAANAYTEDEYREILVDVALRHFSDASPDVRAFAKRELSRNVTIDGFRSFDRAPVDLARWHVVRQMEQVPGVATAVICLWAEAEKKLIDELQAVAEERGLQFRPDWTWQEARDGFHAFEDIVPLTECTTVLAQDRSSPEADHLWLATLWLSRALIESPEVATQSATSQPPEAPTEQAETLLSGTAPDITGPLDLNETLPALSRSLQERVHQIDQARQVAVSQARTMLASAEDSNLAMAEAQLVLLQDALSNWRIKQGTLEKTARRASARIANELEARPDVDLTVPAGTLFSEQKPTSIAPQEAAQDVLTALERILDYDREKQKVLDQLDQVRVRILELQEDITGWVRDESPDMRGALPPAGAELEITLTEVQAILEQATAEQRRLENQRSQLRELSLNRIATLIGRLQELGIPTDTIVSDDLTLGVLASSNLAGWNSRRLWSLEQRLVDQLNEQVVKAKSTAPETTAAQLQSDWNDDKLIELLTYLTGEKLDVEALLLLLAANAAHPRIQTIGLARSVVSSLLRGIGQLSRKTHPFELLNSLAADLLNGWEAREPESQSELCLVFLAAQYGSGHRLPDGFLWQLPVEWPLDRMENWGRLWQSALKSEPLPSIISAQDNGRAARLEEARSRAEQMLACEHGIFVRLASLKSGRHVALLRSEMMPDLVSRLATLQDLERKLQSSKQKHLPRLLADLERLLSGELGEALQEDTLIERYEAGATEEGIVDHDPFHRRTALRILQDCAESILDYGQALLEFWRAKRQREASVTREALQAELAVLPELTPLGQAALDQIAQGMDTEWPQWNEGIAHSLASRQVVHELLTQTAYAMRLPRVVGCLTGAQLDWTEMLEHVLGDLARPSDTGGAATLLMEQEAPNQVLLLTQYVSLDIQKQAQSLKRANEREIDGLQTELLKAGGSAEDLLGDRELGRWRLVRQELAQRLAEYQKAYEYKIQQMQDQARHLRQTINDLDLAVFESKSTMPADAYQLVEQGLNLARRATGTEGLFDQVEAYLQEIRYRLEHQSWPLAELQAATDQLERVMDRPAVFRDVARNAEDVLDLLQRGELRPLNLNPNEVTTSEVGTRCDLLRNWLSVRALPTLMSDGLKAADRATIQSLFRYFTRMVAMRRTRTPDGKPMVYEHPAVYSYWELQYPKTAVLENKCILITLPDQPPSAKDLSQLEHLLEDKEWLDYFFVLLFVPGCTAPIYRRLQSSYQGRGLVIIDEPAMLDMVLAEAESKNPLGRLRPLMLNALGAENVDVFKVNQLVKSRTAIFVGRESLVERIASSGDNYAVYGGRRIGKSSVLAAVEELLQRRGVSVVLDSFEGHPDCSDDASARTLAQLLKLPGQVQGVEDFKLALQAHLDATPDLNLVLLLDEIDRYIIDNPERHVLVEMLRALSDRYGSRFRVVVAGFMSLFDCLRGRGPYTPTSDPWRRMLNDIGALENLRPASAERIVREGFLDILGWRFENRAIPQRIVELTGGHPAFVQYFCLKLQERVGRRGDRLIRLEDVEAIFADRDPEQSFIAYVRKTLDMNLDPIGQYLILWLTAESSEAQGFTLDQMRTLAANVTGVSIPEKRLDRSLERLSVTSVVKENVPQVYEFSVPDYPSILDQLGGTAHLEHLEKELERCLKTDDDVNT